MQKKQKYSTNNDPAGPADYNVFRRWIHALNPPTGYHFNLYLVSSFGIVGLRFYLAYVDQSSSSYNSRLQLVQQLWVTNMNVSSGLVKYFNKMFGPSSLLI